MILKLLKGLGLLQTECVACGKDGNYKEQGYVCEDCLNKLKPFHPIEHRHIDYVFSYRVFSAYEGVLKEVIRSIKFDLNIPLAIRLGKIISPYLWEYMNDIDADLITCPPLNYRRMWTRGFNHVEKILQGAGIKPMSIFVRRGFSKPMAFLSTTERAKAVKEYQIRREMIDFVYQKKILIVDDLLTNGITISRLAELLLSVGANEVHAFFVAKRVEGV